jgi:hypothetical protein
MCALPQSVLNNYRVIAPTATFAISSPKADSVLVVGDWDNWQVGGWSHGVCMCTCMDVSGLGRMRAPACPPPRAKVYAEHDTDNADTIKPCCMRLLSCYLLSGRWAPRM